MRPFPFDSDKLLPGTRTRFFEALELLDDAKKDRSVVGVDFYATANIAATLVLADTIQRTGTVTAECVHDVAQAISDFNVEFRRKEFHRHI